MKLKTFVNRVEFEWMCSVGVVIFLALGEVAATGAAGAERHPNRTARPLGQSPVDDVTPSLIHRCVPESVAVAG